MEQGRRWDERAAWEAAAPVLPVLVGELIKTSRKCKPGEKVRSATISTIYTIFVSAPLICVYIGQILYFFILKLEVKIV